MVCTIVPTKLSDIAIDEVVLAFVVVATPGWIVALADQPTIYHIPGELLGTLVYRKRDALMIALVVVSATLKRESASVSLGVLGMIVPCRFVTNMIHYVSSATTRNVFVAKRVTM